ncbi:zinc-ribbon domain-containing protein [Macrococcus hajekii]|uniref:Zinc-ribbon domain-containing protein n=1 Tax=Macrococcus hajekii TaxID=198482 RepID=A0A4R6BLG4_9STAP|nr:zinc-ribbon domain-containing protein [Macrococcus hajekii]TDM02538.1 zinc-ribbon domain-containing protein [Macrococcus hajekii]GGB01773.1 zinc ribbon domain-containing protein [Macrococcus hajekii]
MKFCKNCGAELKEGQKVCTKCGTPVEDLTATSTTAAETTTYTTPVHKEPKQPMPKRTKIILLASLLGLLLLFGVYKLLESQYSVVGQANKITQAINEENADKLKGLVESENKAISKDEAAAFIKYIKATDNGNQFTYDLKSQVDTLNRFNQFSTEIYANNEKALTLSKDGKALGLFKKYQFDVPKKNISYYANDDSTLQFKHNDKDQIIKNVSSEEAELGHFVLGDYEIPATKKINDKSFKGNLNIKMSNDNEVTEDFNLGYITVNLTNAYGLSTDSINYFADGKEVNLNNDTNKIGPFDTDKEVKVHAETDIDGKNFKSSTQAVKVTKDADANLADIEFDEDEMQNYVSDNREKEALKEEERSDRRNIDVTSEQFFMDYMKGPHLDEFKSVKVGMTKDEAEDLLGSDSSYIDTSKDNLRRCGNFGIEYTDDDKVKNILIVPDDYMDIDYDELNEHYGKPMYNDTDEDGHKRYYMDGNMNNGFVIVILMDDNGYIDYMYQKPEESSDPWRQ